MMLVNSVVCLVNDSVLLTMAHSTVYESISPCWCSSGGGSHVKEIDVELRGTPIRPSGGRVGAVTKTVHMNFPCGN